MLLVQPNGSKTVKGRRIGAIIPAYASVAQHHSLPRLMRYLSITALSSSGLGNVCRSISLPPSCMRQSNHEFSRGHMQDCAAAGMDRSATGQMAQIKTLAIIDCYLDVSKHAVRQSQGMKRT